MSLIKLKPLYITAFTLTLWALNPMAKAEERVVASVDGHLIMQSDVQKALGNRANTEVNRKQALEKVIENFIEQRERKATNAQVDYAQVNEVIENIAVQNGITYGQLLDYLDSQHITLEQYRQQIAQQMIMEQVRHQAIGKAIHVVPQEVQALAKQMLEKDKAQNKVKSASDNQYRISHILLKNTPILNDQQAQQQLKTLLTEINAGKISFEKAARQHSVDYVSAAEGGDLGWNFLDVYDQSFANIAKKSKQDVVSAPFKSQFGWHILKVTDTRQSDRTEDAYLQRAYEQLVNQQIKDAQKDWVKALKKRADIKYF